MKIIILLGILAFNAISQARPQGQLNCEQYNGSELIAQGEVTHFDGGPRDSLRSEIGNNLIKEEEHKTLRLIKLLKSEELKLFLNKNNYRRIDKIEFGEHVPCLQPGHVTNFCVVTKEGRGIKTSTKFVVGACGSFEDEVLALENHPDCRLE